MKRISATPLLLLNFLSCTILTSVAFGASSDGMLLAPPLAPNDPYFSQQWSLRNDGSQFVPIDADDLHTIQQQGVAGVDIGWLDALPEVSTRATNPVTVAVIDSGIDAGHPDLVGRIAPGAFDFLLNFPIVTDRVGHGTHVSGIIAANGNNDIGIEGIAPASVKILPLRVLWAGNDPKANQFSYPDPKSPDPKHPNFKLISDFSADAIRYAVAHGASIINMSLGWPKIVDTANVRQAVQDAIKAGVLLVVAAGNDRKDQPTYPCAYEGVLCVGSITNTGAMALYSNLGGMVDVVAPGDSILSTYPQQVESEVLRIQGYETLTGTSQASPEIAGIAAVLKSVYPNILLNELKARILVSAGKLPSPGSALYGLANLKHAIDTQPQPVFLPDFKALDEVTVDEDRLQAQGQVSVQNLWKTATGVQAQVFVNNEQAGSAKADSLDSNGTLTVPWTYSFASLDDSSNLHVSLRISDDSGDSKEFSIDASAVRAMNKIKANQIFSVPGINAPDWINFVNGHPYSKIGTIDSYPKEIGLPRYYQQLGYGSSGSTLEIYDPSSATLIQRIEVNGIRKIEQVIRIDLNGDGKREWVITGLDQDPNDKTPNYWAFNFLDSNFQPLTGDLVTSQWQISNAGGQRIVRNYALPGSWIKVNGRLFPSFLSQGTLPAKDNFGELDQRHFGSAMHLYFYSPVDTPAGNPLQLEIRALDNAVFRTKYPSLNLQNIIPSSPDDQFAGHIRVLATLGDNLDAQSVIWDVKSSTDAGSTAPSAGWDSLSASGAPFPAIASDLNSATTGFLSFFDNARGTIAWSDSKGQFLDRTEFSFSSPEDPITGLIGIFNLQSLGRFWFVESGFDLVGYRQAVPGKAEVQTQTMPIERDSSFPEQQFSQMFTPVLVGTPENPLPGVYVDSTLVRGNQVSVAVWDSKSIGLVKPLRYSLLIPDGCLEMNPVQATSVAESFALPLLCQLAAGGLQLEIINP